MFIPYFVGSQKQYRAVFGPASANNFETYMSGWNFLEYGQSLYVVRTANTTAYSGSGATSTALPNTAVNSVGGNGAIGTGSGPTTQDVLNSVVFNASHLANRLAVGGSACTVNGVLSGNFPSSVQWVGKYPGAKGNSLLVSQCDSANQYHCNVAISGQIASGGAAGNTYNGSLTLVPGSNVGQVLVQNTASGLVINGNLFANSIIANYLTVGDIFKVSTGVRGSPYQYLLTTAFSNCVTNSTVTTFNINFSRPYIGGANLVIGGGAGATIERYWQFWKNCPAPSNWISNTQINSSNPTIADVMQIVVVDQYGAFSGVPNTVLEVYNNVSRATDSVNPDGTSKFYRNVINTNSPYIWSVNDRVGAVSNTAASLTAVTTGNTVFTSYLSGGQDGDSESNAPMQTLINGWTYFQGVDQITIDLVIGGKPNGSSAVAGSSGTTYNNFGMAGWLISNIAQYRKDCVVFFSPDRSVVLNNIGMEAIDLINWASLIPPSTYAFMDNNYKYQYDADNNVYRWVPFNGDVAGLCAYTDTIAHPWYSPAGFNRGVISNVTQVAYNAQEPDRDLFYPQGINPIVSFPGRGTVLYGDRTFTSNSTGFNRLNVRRLFLVVERAIKAFAQNTLFELNDVFTQNQFKNMITPYLRGIVGGNGISDFLIVCDKTINTPTIADNEEFLCAIYIKPIHSINFIQITYVNTPSGTSFSTIENVSL